MKKTGIILDRTTIMRYGASGLLFLLLSVLLTFELRTPSLPGENEVSTYKVKAPNDLEFVDKLEYDKDLQDALNNVKMVYKYDPTATERQKSKLIEFLETLRSADPVDDLGVDPQLAGSLRKYRDIDFNVIRDNVLRLFDRAQEEKITPESLLAMYSRMTGWVEDLPYQRLSKDILIHLLEKSVAPNYVEDTEAINRAKEKVTESIIPTKRFIRRGETIVDDGQIVTSDIVQIFNAYGLEAKRGSSAMAAAGAVLFTFILFVTGSLYLSKFNPGVLEDEDLVVLLCTLLGIAFLVLKFLPLIFVREDFVLASIANIPLFSSYIVPLAAFPMMISILIDSKFAILINIILAAAGGLWSEAGLNFTIVNLIAGTIAVYCVLQVNQRVDLTRAGMLVSISNMLLITSLSLLTQHLVSEDSLWRILVRDNIWGFFNGFACSVLVIGGLPYLEQFFSVSSSLRLHELADLNQPLLRTLLLEAPGTYHHSIVVGNLAESGAKEVGANPLVARIGAYYHDIGKMKRPYFFSENQIGIENQHNNLTPNLSAIIIESHVKDGVELARQHNIPEFITDIIGQHHGTTLISFFYHQAKMDERQKVGEEYFRYPGPKPKTKEAAVVMMADSVESATRAMQEPTHSSISALVKRIINDKFVDGQFNDCDITLKDMEKLANVFIRLLVSMFHSRIEYPDLNELKGKEKQDANSSRGREQQQELPDSATVV